MFVCLLCTTILLLRDDLQKASVDTFGKQVPGVTTGQNVGDIR